MASYTITKIKAGGTTYTVRDNTAYHSSTPTTVHSVSKGTADSVPTRYTFSPFKAASVDKTSFLTSVSDSSSGGSGMQLGSIAIDPNDSACLVFTTGSGSFAEDVSVGTGSFTQRAPVASFTEATQDTIYAINGTIGTTESFVTTLTK